MLRTKQSLSNVMEVDKMTSKKYFKEIDTLSKMRNEHLT